jgi:germination protein YpeB
MNKLGNKAYIIIIILLMILSAITGYYAYNLREKYLNSNLNNYNEAFSNVVDYVNKIEKSLAKATITKSSSYGAETLTKVWGDANLAIAYLSHIPISNDGLSQTAKFLNQVSDYSYTLYKKNMNNEDLTDEELENLESLHTYAVDLENTLNQLENDLYSGEVSWNELTSSNTLQYAQAVDNVSVFSTIDSNFEEYEGLIYDGAYSEHIEKVDKKGLTGEDISEDEAEIIVRNLYSSEQIKNITRNGFIENANIPEYDFTVEFENSDVTSNVEISKKGGHIILIEKNRDVNEIKISNQEAKEVGKEFLSSLDFKNMKQTYYSTIENIITVNYAYEQNGITVYPDLIKVKIALDNGEILGLESSGYLNSHETRTINEAKISIEEAKENLNSNLEITSEGKAIIPTKWKTEIVCYEFKGKVKDTEFLIYVNCQTGKEEDILVVIDNENGEITI